MTTTKRRAALAAIPVTLGLLLAGPAVGTAAAAPPSDTEAQARCLLLCSEHHYYPYHHWHHSHHWHGHLLGLHLGIL